MTNSMRAIRVDQPGGQPYVADDVSIPKPEEGQILVRAVFTAINPVYAPHFTPLLFQLHRRECILTGPAIPSWRKQAQWCSPSLLAPAVTLAALLLRQAQRRSTRWAGSGTMAIECLAARDWAHQGIRRGVNMWVLRLNRSRGKG